MFPVHPAHTGRLLSRCNQRFRHFCLADPGGNIDTTIERKSESCGAGCEDPNGEKAQGECLCPGLAVGTEPEEAERDEGCEREETAANAENRAGSNDV